MKIETLKIGEATLTAYIQKNAPEIKNADRRPAVLILPGGGYEFVSNPENEPVALEYSAKGFQAFTLEYSVKEKGVFPVPETEVLRATAVVRARAEEWFVDKEKIALVGFSAGGHLAAHLGTQWHLPLLRETLGGESADFRPDAMVLCYPVISGIRSPHLHSFLNLTGPDPAQETLARLSCEESVDGRTPPAFLWHTANDTCVPVENSLVMAGALAKAGVPVELHVFPNGLHGLSVCTYETAAGGSEDRVYPYVARWVPWSVRFLENVFRGGDFRR